MGMFDWINIPCPYCGEIIKEQSKAGPCEMNEYDLWWGPRMPEPIARELMGRTYRCGKCDQLFGIDGQLIVNVYLHGGPE